MAQSAEHPGSWESNATLQRLAAKEFSRALGKAQRAADKSNPELAIGWCRYAASLAWGVNPGLFYSHEMEQLLSEIGRRHLGSVPAPPPDHCPPRRFLHVMSTAAETGGSTPAVARWIEICALQAPSEQHSILISFQDNSPVPACLTQAAQKTGGDIIQIPMGSSLLMAAAEIRSRSFEFDTVILHIEPSDPLPDVAFFDRPRPVLFFRHAEHAFNLGQDLAGVVADVRPVGHEMTVHFCAKGPQTAMLPLPLLDQPLIGCNKAEARQRLGLPQDASILLTIGWPFKYASAWGYSFPALVQSLCQSNSRICIVAIGLSPSEPFPGLNQATEGRFLPVGVVEDREALELYYCSADIYLDAYPRGSLTAVLDAARRGLPVQRLSNPYQCIMWSDDISLDSVMSGASSQEDYVQTVLEWLKGSEEKRSQLGARFRNAVLQDHCGADWKNKWLDPALRALVSPREDRVEFESNPSQNEPTNYPGLGLAWPETDWPAGMMVAGAILSTTHLPRAISVHGVLQTFKPVLLSMPGKGSTRKRLHMFGLLIASFMPKFIRAAMRGIWRAAVKHLQDSRRGA